MIVLGGVVIVWIIQIVMIPVEVIEFLMMGPEVDIIVHVQFST